MYYSMPINMCFIVKYHWEPYFTDNLRMSAVTNMEPASVNSAVVAGDKS
jgi:hypothetical protein